jgi:hypothetical protein
MGVVACLVVFVVLDLRPTVSHRTVFIWATAFLAPAPIVVVPVVFKTAVVASVFPHWIAKQQGAPGRVSELIVMHQRNVR